jgi:hypothetical protein
VTDIDIDEKDHAGKADEQPRCLAPTQAGALAGVTLISASRGLSTGT